MSLLAPALAGANYMTSNNEDKESASNGAAEFTRRKKWPEILLKELVGGTIFCLKPVLVRRTSQQQPSGGSTWGWKIIYVSPASADMIGQKPAELDGKDFFDLVFAPDHPQLYTFFTSLLTPSLPHHSSSGTVATTSSTFGSQGNHLSPSQTTYVRMLAGSGDSPSSSSDTPSSSSRRLGPVVWELRAHASGLGDDANTTNLGLEGFGGAAGGMGTVNPSGGEEGGMKGKAIWVMGRRIGENAGDSEGSGNGNSNGNGNGNGQSLDAFLELKLENERLREELRELQLDLDEDYAPPRMGSYSDISPTKPHAYYDPSSPSSSSGQSSSGSSLKNLPRTDQIKVKNKTGRPPKDPNAPSGSGPSGADREKKRIKKMSLSAQGGEKEGMHVCVTCGRTDSPEWRKGPLGPKTLCNACGLRWAKRNSTQPGRKERKNDGKK